LSILKYYPLFCLFKCAGVLNEDWVPWILRVVESLLALATALSDDIGYGSIRTFPVVQL